MAIVAGILFGAATMETDVRRAIDIAFAVSLTTINICMTIDLKR